MCHFVVLELLGDFHPSLVHPVHAMAEAIGLISGVITILAAVNEGSKSVNAVRCASEDFERLQVTLLDSYCSIYLIYVLVSVVSL